MIRTEVRFDVRLISRDALKGYMAFRGGRRPVSVRELAERIGNPSARSTIGHLLSGERSTCKPETAHAIEKALNAPPGSLFVAKVSTVQRETGQAA